jgi:hypothetical protein
MTNKKQYIQPRVIKIDIDSTITLIMKSHVKPPKPRGGTTNDSQPFASPFGDKPFG